MIGLNLNSKLFICFLLNFPHRLAIRFTIEPSNIVVSEGSSVLLPCEGEITQTNADHLLTKRKFNKNRLDLLPNIRWRGPDGQDIGIVGDTFR